MACQREAGSVARRCIRAATWRLSAAPSIASGVRVGTPCVTTQGMGLAEMDVIADVIHRAVTETDGSADNAVAKEIREQVTDLVTRFPAYPR